VSVRIASAVLGIVGGVVGGYFAEMVVTLSVLFAVMASQSGEVSIGSEFYLALLALVSYALGVAGGVVVLVRAPIGAVLQLVAATGGLVSAFAISGGVPQGRDVVLGLFPYAGAVLLFAGGALAAFSARTSRVAVEASAPAAATTHEGAPSQAQLASAVPMQLLAAPVANAPARREIAPGTTFESLEHEGEFVHVRGSDFDGYLPSWSVRRV
jgi:hypothetical protein